MERPSSADTFIAWAWKGADHDSYTFIYVYIYHIIYVFSFQLGLLWTCWKFESGDKYFFLNTLLLVLLTWSSTCEFSVSHDLRVAPLRNSIYVVILFGYNGCKPCKSFKKDGAQARDMFIHRTSFQTVHLQKDKKIRVFFSAHHLVFVLNTCILFLELAIS